MKIRLLYVFLLMIFVFGMVHAADFETNKSTNCTASSTLQVIPGTDPGDFLGSFMINSRTAGAENMKIYNSSGTATNLIATIDLSSGPLTGAEYIYNLRISSAITVSKSGGNADTTLIWKNVR